MFIPIGLDKDEVRRTPWVTWTLIASNVLIFLVLWIAQSGSGLPARFEEQSKAVFDYLSSHPYLEIPPELGSRLGEEDLQRLARARQEMAKSRATPPEWEIALRQKELDDMVRALLATARESPLTRWGFVPAKPNALHYLTSMFVHAGWAHLAGNMIFLFVTGPFVEDAYGRILYPILYLASGVVGDLLHAAHNPESLVPTVGASGAISGIMGAFLVRYLKRRIIFLWMPFFPFPWFSRQFRIPAFFYLPFWFLTQILVSSISTEDSRVASWAHIGGFVFGVVFALVIGMSGLERKWIEPAIAAEVGGPGDSDLIHAVESGARGDFAEARRATDRVLARDPRNLDARRYAYDVALERNDPSDVGAQASRLLDAYLQDGQEELAGSFIREATDNSLSSLSPRFLLKAGEFLERHGDPRGALHLYDRLLETSPVDHAALRALVQRSDIHRRLGDTAKATGDLLHAQSHPDYGEEWRALIDSRLAALTRDPPSTGYRGSRR